MASLTEAEAKTMVEKLVLLRDAIYTRLEVTSTTIVSLLRDASESAKGDRAYDYLQGVAQIRAGLAAIARIDLIGPALDAAVLSYAEVLDAPTNDPVAAFLALWRNYNADGHAINGREISFGSFSFSGATGDGAIHRLTVDENGDPIEICPTGGDSWEARCIADQNSPGVNEHQEQFLLESSYASPDGLERIGSGVAATLQALTVNDGILLNGSFSQGTSASSITNWDVDSGAVATTTKDTTNYYRSVPNETTPASLNTGAQSLTIAQHIKTTGRRLDRNTPYYVQIAFNRTVGSSSGTLAIHVGAVSESVSVSAQSGWTILRFTLGTKNWALNQTEDQLDVRVVWTHSGGTGLRIDDFIVAPMTRVRGQWVAIVGGGTPFMLEDTATATDSISTEATISEALAARYGAAAGVTLASATGAGEDWADP